MKRAFKEIATGLASLFTGMKITIGEFFKPTVTLHYPHESLKMTPRFRGHIELVRDPETGKALCYACKLCERSCPTNCISVDGVKKEGDKKKSVSEFKLDFTTCSLCGSCVEACKSGAIRFSKDYNLASTKPEDFVMDLFKRLEDEAVTADKTEAAVAPVAPAAPAAPAAAAPEAPKPAAKPEEGKQA